ncbi:MAG: phosphate acetyltransferase [Deltaproteobacteria bacterium SM23_61]|nr:MAG: phosphate acetyltransferase [Deltaproteobacteria bacterium SM23_61]
MPKAKSIYVFGAEPQAGKSVVLLGIMEVLSRQVQKLGFFRPLVREGETKDDAIRLISNRYHLPLPNRIKYGMTHEKARALVAEEKYDEVLKRILEGYGSLESDCDVVVCLGTGFHDIPPGLALDFNIDVANNLGALAAPVATGWGRTSQEVIRRSLVLLNLLEAKRCDVLALFVNRVAPERVDEILGLLAREKSQVPIFALPELAMLAKPTVGEIAEYLGATRWSGDPESFTREVEDIKIGAMELPNFLNHLVEGTLVITPGDRSDIILGSLLADAASTYPRVAGLLLTGGLRPAPQVERIIEGLRKSPVPVLTVEVDTFTAGTQASQVRGRIRPENPRKMAVALGHMEKYMNAQALRQRIDLSRPERVTPIMFEHSLVEQAKSNRRHIVLPEGTEERILRAAEILLLRGVADLTLLGPISEIEQKASSLGLSLKGAAFLDPAEPEHREEYAHTYYELRKHKGISEQMAFDLVADVAYFGTLMVHRAEADGLVSGAVHTTAHTLRPAFEIIGLKPGFSLASSVFFMCLPDRVFVFGDCAVNPEPTMEQLADIATSSAETAWAFGIEPRVAMLSYSTGESGKGADVDKVREATRRVRSLRPDLPVEGPIQYDAAVDPSVARVKLPGSQVAGRATVFIFPDLNNGNITYKAVQRSANAVAIGPVIQGLKRPVNDLSRGATVTDIVNTVAITAIQAQETVSQSNAWMRGSQVPKL